MSDENGLSSSEINEVYRRKYARYTDSLRAKGIPMDHFINSDVIADARVRLEELRAKGKIVALTGSEFVERPPTSAGLRTYADGLARAMWMREFISRYTEVRTDFPDRAKALEGLFREAAGELIPILDRVIEDFHRTAGCDPEGNFNGNKKSRAEGLQRFSLSSMEYRNFMKGVNRRLSLRLMDEYIPRIPDVHKYEDMDATSLDGDYVGIVRMEKDYGDTLSSENHAKLAMLMESSAKAGRAFLKRLGIREAVGPVVLDAANALGIGSLQGKAMADAYNEYYYNVGESLREILRTKRAAYIYAKYLTEGDLPDRILAEYADPSWGIECKLLPEDTPVKAMKGFVSIRSAESRRETGPLSGMEDFRRERRFLTEYLKAHYAQFEAQHVTSVFVGTNGLPDCMETARSVRNRIDVLTKEGFLNSLHEEEQGELLNIWALSAMMCKSGFAVMEFAEEYEDKTAGEAAEALKDILDEISITRAEKSTREPLKRILAKRKKGDV